MSPTGSGPAIVVEGLAKSFGEVRALRDIDLAVPHGTVLGVLGPNGAGKTTAVRILTTLCARTAGGPWSRATMWSGRPRPSAARSAGPGSRQRSRRSSPDGRTWRLYHLSWPDARSRVTGLLE